MLQENVKMMLTLGPRLSESSTSAPAPRHRPGRLFKALPSDGFHQDSVADARCHASIQQVHDKTGHDTRQCPRWCFGSPSNTVLEIAVHVLCALHSHVHILTGLRFLHHHICRWLCPCQTFRGADSARHNSPVPIPGTTPSRALSRKPPLSTHAARHPAPRYRIRG